MTRRNRRHGETQNVMKDETSDMDDILQREEVRKALWNAVLPATRQVDPVRNFLLNITARNRMTYRCCGIQ